MLYFLIGIGIGLEIVKVEEVEKKNAKRYDVWVWKK